MNDVRQPGTRPEKKEEADRIKRAIDIHIKAMIYNLNAWKEERDLNLLKSTKFYLDNLISIAEYEKEHNFKA